MTYKEKLKDPKWQKRRLEVLQAHEWACDRCGDKTTELHVHHLRYITGLEPWDYDDKDLCVLCDPHHKEWHVNMETLQLAIARMSPAAFENLVGYAVANTVFSNPDEFRQYSPIGCATGGIIAVIDIRGNDGIRFLEDHANPDGTLDMQRIIGDAMEEKYLAAEERKQELAEMWESLKKLAG